MHRYIIKRLLLMIPVIIGVSFLVFFIMDLAPGDAVDILAPEGATAEDLDAIRHDPVSYTHLAEAGDQPVFRAAV